jgi:LPXTG-motif cell wall-anchored protein
VSVAQARLPIGAATGSGTLPSTGGDATSLVQIAAILSAVGAALTIVRRRPSQPAPVRQR